MSARIAILLLAMSAWLAIGHDLGSIDGVIRNHGSTVAGATLTLSPVGETWQPIKVISDGQGAYRFDGLRPHRYQVVVEAAGFARATKAVDVTAIEAKVDFDVNPVALKFAAAGVRGLIDPGGYSAPASAASASGLITGMADIQRQNNTSAKDWPCGMETKLRRDADSHSADAELRLGEFYLAHSRFQEAYPPLKRSADERPDAHTFSLLAQAYEGAAMFTDASLAYDSSAKLNETEENLFGVGYELILNGSAEAGATKFRDALKMLPHSFKLWTGSGAAEFMAGHLDFAVNDFLQAIDLEPNNTLGYDYLAKAVNGGRTPDARVEAAFHRFVGANPRNPKALYYNALSLRSRNPVDPSIESFLQRSIDLDPDFPDAHIELASFYLATRYSAKGNTANAITQYQMAIRLAPAVAQSHYRLAQVYRSSGEQQKAAAELAVFQSLKSRQLSHTGPEIDLKPFISVLSLPSPTQACPVGAQP